MTNEYYFERPAMVKMSIDKRVLHKSNIKVAGHDTIILKWTSDEKKVIETLTFQFVIGGNKEAIAKINELYILNGDIFNEIIIWNE